MQAGEYDMDVMFGKEVEDDVADAGAADSDSEPVTIVDQLGNIWDRRDVCDVTAKCVEKIVPDSGKAVMVSRKIREAAVRSGGNEEFKNTGSFKTSSGYGFIRLGLGVTSLQLHLNRPTTVVVCTPSKSDSDNTLSKWEKVSAESLDPIVTVDKKETTTYEYMKRKKYLRT